MPGYHKQDPQLAASSSGCRKRILDLELQRLELTQASLARDLFDLGRPEIDYVALARSMGCYGEGPIEHPKDVRPALERALAEVKKGRLALVDTITQHR